MRFFGLRTCDTCRRALAALQAAGMEPAVIDVRSDGVARADLVRLLDRFGEDLINRRSTTWRRLGADERARLICWRPTRR